MAPKAKRKGNVRKRREHRAARRKATQPVRDAYNAQKRMEGHPGWSTTNQ